MDWLLNIMPGRLLFSLLACCTLLPLATFSPPPKPKNKPTILVRYVGEEVSDLPKPGSVEH